MITCISYENIFAISVPKCINMAPLYTWIICVTVPDGICNMDCTGLHLLKVEQYKSILVEI